MTVRGLAWELAVGMLTGRFRPGDRVVREWGDWDARGRSTFKEVLFLDPASLPEHPDPTPAGCAGGINHTMYSGRGTLPPRRVVKLD